MLLANSLKNALENQTWTLGGYISESANCLPQCSEPIKLELAEVATGEKCQGTL